MWPTVAPAVVFIAGDMGAQEGPRHVHSARPGAGKSMDSGLRGWPLSILFVPRVQLVTDQETATRTPAPGWVRDGRGVLDKDTNKQTLLSRGWVSQACGHWWKTLQGSSRSFCEVPLRCPTFPTGALGLTPWKRKTPPQGS